MDLILIDNNPTLDIVDTHTGFRSATVLKGKAVDKLCHAFVEYWARHYTRYPNIITLNQDAELTAKSFRDLAAAHRISLQFSGAQSYNTIGAGEKYHEPLHRIFRILRQRHQRWNLKSY